MGVLSFFQKVGETIIGVGATVVRAITHPIEAVNVVVSAIETIKTRDPRPVIDATCDFWGLPRLSEDEEIYRIEKENEMIARYQKKVVERATMRENNVSNAYKKIYDEYLKEIGNIANNEIVGEIKHHIDETSQTFTNSLRDEVKEKVNSSYPKWQKLMSTHPTHNIVQDYCDQVYNDADDNLLTLLQSKIKETNLFISQRINDYANDRNKALDELKERFRKLTSDEETKSQELMECAKEITVAQYIVYETSKNI